MKTIIEVLIDGYGHPWGMMLTWAGVVLLLLKLGYANVAVGVVVGMGLCLLSSVCLGLREKRRY